MFFLFYLWSIFYPGHCGDVSNTLLYWTAFKRYSTVLEKYSIIIQRNTWYDIMIIIWYRHRTVKTVGHYDGRSCSDAKQAPSHTKQGKSEGFDSCDRPSNLKLDSNRQFFCPCDREIWWMTLQNNRAPLLCYFKLCASFCTHWWIQT